jgi:hypothetical protein
VDLFKNVSLHSLDVGGGHVLASGEIAELSGDARPVHHAVRTGDLVEVGSSETPDQSRATAGKPASNSKSQES